ncbi:hypothetical protein Gotri_004435, partial [Gossypium trilobum]|nr:hypothetical protein [Gossypium trilobum]
MTRKRVKLAYITNDSVRKVTYKNIMKGLTRKMSEMSTLCGVDTCAIMYSPYKSQPEVWPSPMGVIHGLNFRALSVINLLFDKKMSDIDKRIDALAKAPFNPQEVSSSSSSSMVALPPMTMVTPEVMARTGTEDIMQLDVNNMDPTQRQQWIMEVMRNNDNPQTNVRVDEMMFQFCDNINPNNDL